MPKVKKRRLYDRKAFGKLYYESNNDFVDNNMDACVWFLEHRDEVNDLLKQRTIK